MATIVPPPSKRQKKAANALKVEEEERKKIPEGLGSIRVQFVDASSGHATGAPVAVPVAQASVKNLELLLNTIQGQDDDSHDKVPYRFTFHSSRSDPSQSQALDIEDSIYHSLLSPDSTRPLGISTETLLTLHYTPLSVFRVRAVSRPSSSIPGHTAAILATQFAPHNSSRMVSGGGDGTARIWDCETGTPFMTLRGHQSWVLATSWSPDGKLIATGSYDNTIRVWDAATGSGIHSRETTKNSTSDSEPTADEKTPAPPQPLKGHTKWITALSWEPFHLQTPGRPRLASSSKDGTVRIWDIVSRRADMTLSRHTAGVSCIKWGGLGKAGHIYTTSLDRTVKIWDAYNGQLLYNLTAHAHRVNHLALSTDFVIRTGFFEPGAQEPPPRTEAQQQLVASQRFEQASRVGGSQIERFATASDDNKILVWSWDGKEKPAKSIRLDGHQKQVNHVAFSPDGHYIASCGFDNHVILWDSTTGNFIKKLIGHVAPVYQCCFSADSRLLVSASKDTTIKAWDVKTGKLVQDLPGHKDEVFAVDWSPDGLRVGSGGKDKVVKIWTH